MSTAVAAATEEIFARLPEHYQAADTPAGDPLKRWLSLIGDQVDELDVVYGQVASGLLGDPDNAPAEWLPWMAQLVALDTTGLTAPEIRFAIGLSTALRGGSMQALEETVEGLLGGEKRYIIETHAGGDPFAIIIYVHFDDDVGATWDSLAIQYPTWSAWQAAASWDDLFATSPLADQATFTKVKPAWVLLGFETLAEGHSWLFLERAITSWDEWEAEFIDWIQFETQEYPWQ